jgi:hypothetical protein
LGQWYLNDAQIRAAIVASCSGCLASGSSLHVSALVTLHTTDPWAGTPRSLEHVHATHMFAWFLWNPVSGSKSMGWSVVVCSIDGGQCLAVLRLGHLVLYMFYMFCMLGFAGAASWQIRNVTVQMLAIMPK